MAYVLLFIAVTLLFVGIGLLAIRPSRDQRAAIDRVKQLSKTQEIDPDDSEEHLLSEDTVGRFAWLRNLIRNTSLSRHIEKIIQQAGAKTQIEVVLFQSAAAAFGGFLLTWFLLPALSTQLIGLFACAWIPYLTLRIQRNKRLKAFDHALTDAIDMISRSLKAGHAISAAFEIAVEQAREPVSSEFRILTARTRHGMALREAYTQLAERVPTADLRIFITAVLVNYEAGGNLPNVLDRLTEMIRVRTRLMGDMRAKTAQGRLTGIILIVLPLALALLMKLSNPGYIDPFFSNHTGQILMIYSICSWLIGGTMIYRITRMEV
jgi:tight adherence protein B